MSLRANINTFKASSLRHYSGVAAFIGALIVLAGPFLLLTNGGRELTSLPWYLWVILPLILFLVLLAGALVFRHDSRHADDISISPDHKGR